MRKTILRVGIAQRGTGAAGSATSVTRIAVPNSVNAKTSILRPTNLLSTTRRVRSVIASDDPSVGTLLTSTVGPLGSSRSSHLKAADGLFAEESKEWRRGGEAGEGDEKGVGEEHREESNQRVCMICCLG